MTADTVLIVDDEDPVRRTFQEWLEGGRLGVAVLAAADAETALRIASDHPIDLAVLDWHLGSGTDGLRLLEDLGEFQPDIAAILVTGFANQATPLDALRMGVRDYLDKNRDLTRETFLAAVRRQLDRIRPAKRQRELNRSLAGFREAVGKALPLVRAAAALTDPVPLPDAVHALVRFLLRATGAADGVLVARPPPADGDPADAVVAYDRDGNRADAGGVAFRRSVAAAAVSRQGPVVLTAADAGDGAVDLMPFERGRGTILAVPLAVGGGTQAVIELFDKPQFTADDQRLAAAAADIGADLVRQALAERHTHRLLADAVEAALAAGDRVSAAIAPAPDEPPPAAVLDRLREGMDAGVHAVVDGDTGVKLVEAVRALAVRHGRPAVDHCVTLVTSLRHLLDATAGDGRG